jgi:serine/threonine-protein kinase
MLPGRTLQGINGIYLINDLQPFAYGRISVLFKGMDQNQGSVCIKIFRYPPRAPGERSLMNEFIRELTAQKALKHPHILPIVDFGRETSEEPAPFLILPLCEKGDLRHFMKSKSFIPFEEALPVLQQVALAIDFAHKSGFIHGDIKPENILFLEDVSHCYLSDFGMSKYFSIEEAISTVEPYVGGGSTSYLSPEQIADGKQFPSSDIYSFAMVAYELLTGCLPFDISVPPFKQMVQKIEGTLIDPNDANPALSTEARSALLKALEPSPKKRPSSASEFCQMLITGVSIETIPNERVTTTIKNNVKTDIKQRRLKNFWTSLEPTTKVAIITAIIAAIAGIITAIIQIIPALRK